MFFEGATICKKRKCTCTDHLCNAELKTMINQTDKKTM